MSTRAEVDFTHGPPDLEPSSTPSSLHDGMLERIEVDPRARTVSLWVDVEYLRRFAGLPEDVRFGIVISGVNAMRATRWRFHPDPFERREGEPGAEQSARVVAWQALGQAVSADWDETVRAIAARRMDVQDGTMLSSEGAAALRLSGPVGDDDAWNTSTWVQIEIAGGAIRWSRSDGAAWSADELDALSRRYWNTFAVRAPHA